MTHEEPRHLHSYTAGITLGTTSGCGWASRPRREEASWTVGARYKALEPITLHVRPDLASEEVGEIMKRDELLLLALQEVDEGLLLAYLADTRNPRALAQRQSIQGGINNGHGSSWLAGWGAIRNASGGECLDWTAGAKSWQVGGRYRVAGNVVLRSGVEIETEEVRWLETAEEILILDLGLLLRGGEPKLRARVHTRDDKIGWITVERPGSFPLLHPSNLLTEKAVLGGPLQRVCAALGCTCLAGALAHVPYGEDWRIGGEYRLLTTAAVSESAASTVPFSHIKRGTLVVVEDKVSVPWGQGTAAVVRLQVAAAASDGTPTQGWISATRPDGKVIVDKRDHCEYARVIQQVPPLTMDGQPIKAGEDANGEDEFTAALLGDQERVAAYEIVGPDNDTDVAAPHVMEAVDEKSPEVKVDEVNPEFPGQKHEHQVRVATPFADADADDRPVMTDQPEPQTNQGGCCSSSRRMNVNCLTCK